MHQEKINVLVVDDHALFRKGTMMLIQSFGIINEVSEAENGKEALEVLKSKPCDLVLLDLDMPVLDGKETAKAIIKNYPQIDIIMVSMNEDLSIISELIDMGVHSYILKNTDPTELKKAIDYVLNNDFYYNQIVSKALHQKIKDKPSAEIQNLTKREVEILELICQELTMKQIGDKLFLSEQTVHTHRKNLMKKVNVSNAVGLVKFAIKEKVITL